MAARLTPEAVDAIVQSVECGTALRPAAKANGFTDDQVDEWLAVSRGETHYRNGFPRDPDSIAIITALTERCSRAMAQRFRVLTSSLYHNATTLNLKTGWYDTQAADKLLSKSPDTRHDWREERTVQHSGEVQHHHEHSLVQQLSRPELEAAYQMLEAPESPADTTDQ